MFARLNIKPAPAWLAYFPTKDKPLKDQWMVLRQLAKSPKYSPVVCLRLEWIIFYYTAGKKNASLTATHFGISRKTLHKWLKRFIQNQQRLRSLEDQPKAPHRKRLWQVTGEEEANVIDIRKRHLKYGKHKLASLYRQEYQQSISSWKIERVIRKWQLYPDKQAQAKRVARKRQTARRVRIHQVKDALRTQDKFSLLWHVDAIVIWWYGARRVIFTGIEDLTRVGYAKAYTTNSSTAARDFLFRLRYLAGNDYPITVMHADNGREFDKYFAQACLTLNIQQVYSRVRTPTDNPMLERFNWTIQDEWLSQSRVGLEDIELANDDLTKWLVEYNSVRPHQSLDYQTPLAYAQQHYFKVLPMWSARTQTCISVSNRVNWGGIKFCPMIKLLTVPMWFIGSIATVLLSLWTYTFINASAVNSSPKVLGANSDSAIRSTLAYAAIPQAVSELKTEIKSSDARPLIINNYLAKYQSPMTGMGEFIVSKAEELGNRLPVDPTYLAFLTVAVGQNESNLGKKMPPNCFNAWGYGIHSAGTLCFQSWEEGINKFMTGVAENYITKRGLDTPEEMMTMYTPHSPNGAWAKGVEQFMEDLNQKTPTYAR